MYYRYQTYSDIYTHLLPTPDLCIKWLYLWCYPGPCIMYIKGPSCNATGRGRQSTVGFGSVLSAEVELSKRSRGAARIIVCFRSARAYILFAFHQSVLLEGRWVRQRLYWTPYTTNFAGFPFNGRFKPISLAPTHLPMHVRSSIILIWLNCETRVFSPILVYTIRPTY